MGMAKLGKTLQDATEVTDCLFDAIEHVAPRAVWRNDETGDRAILAADLARLTTGWRTWPALIEARIAGQWVAWEWVNTGLAEGDELALRELTDRKPR